MNFLTWCLTPFLIPAAAQAAPEDGYAQLYWSRTRMLAVYGRHIELYNLGALTPAVSRDEHDARPLLDGKSVRGRPAFLDRDGETVELLPETRDIGADIQIPPETRSDTGAVSICAVDRVGFCGVIALDGEELAELRGEEEPGLRRVPVGASPDGTEALFALKKLSADGREPEIVAYRLWRKTSGAPREELLAPDDPQVSLRLRSYQGELDLPKRRKRRLFR